MADKLTCFESNDKILVCGSCILRIESSNTSSRISWKEERNTGLKFAVNNLTYNFKVIEINQNTMALLNTFWSRCEKIQITKSPRLVIVIVNALGSITKNIHM